MAAAAATLPFLLISLLILFIHCSHIISCFAIAVTTPHEEQGQVPSSVTPKAAAVHYWHLKTHNDKPLPPIFLSKLSPLSPSKLITTNDKATRAMSDRDMDNSLFYQYYDTQDRRPTTSDTDENPLLYQHYDTQDHLTSHYNVDPNNNIKMVTGDEIKEKAAKQISPGPRGIFFRESELKEGKTISLLKFADRDYAQYFLPRSIASKISFSATAISKIFRIPTDSALYSAMKSTISHCRMLPNTGETKQCITSAEDMIDYALSALGANADIQFWSTRNSSGFGGKSSIGKVKVVYDGELTAKPHLTCHQVTFPYLVYHCHSVSNTRVYDWEVLDAKTKVKINQATAVCHLDTTGWDPDHMSFAALQSAPGKTEVCHWISPSDMVLTASDVAAVTAIATAT